VKKKDSINKCQYWSVNEPLQCRWWDHSNIVCTYEFAPAEEKVGPTTVSGAAEYAPYCNLIGTSIRCDQYAQPLPEESEESEGSEDDDEPAKTSEARCILPDSIRHLCNRATGEKWVTSSGIVEDATSSSYAILAWDFDAISGYNDGMCDSHGTDVTCSGYSSYHLGFGLLQPSNEEDKYDTFKDNRYSKIEEFGYRLPTNYVVYNLRAVLSKCLWWTELPGEFIVDAITGLIILDSEWKCTSSNDTAKYKDFSFETGPPCNGCKAECKHYTGVCWEYCIDEKMETGDPILAEQIHELRYYHRENMWKVSDIEDIFIDEGTIFTWGGVKDDGFCEKDDEGENVDEDCVSSEASTVRGTISVTTDSVGNLIEYQIPSVVTWMADFERFEVKTRDEVLTEGTTITKTLKDYPTLVKEIQELPLFPIIKNKYSEVLDADDVTHQFFETPYLKSEMDILIYGKVFFELPTMAMNINDKVLKAVLPQQLYDFEHIHDIEKAFSPEVYENFIIKFRATIKAIKAFFPEKICVNSLPDTDLTFLIEAPTVSRKNSYLNTNSNTIMVWQDTDKYISYSKTTFDKRIVGGILSQSEFILEGDEGRPVSSPPDYEYGFFANANKNGTMTFTYNPFVSGSFPSTVAYFYNDASISNPLTDIGFVGYDMYELKAEEFVLDESEYTILGSNGYMLIDIDHPYLNSIFKIWEFKSVTITYVLETDDEEEPTEELKCEMALVYHGASGLLGHQQLILKPKDPQDLSAACDVTVVFEDLTYWEKRSYGEEPDCDRFAATREVAAEVFTTLDQGTLKSSSEGFTLTDFNFTMTPSVVINNSQGKPFTQYRTKPIGMVNQPSCPDVEIYYSWQAAYTLYQNHPVCKCCGPWTQINPKPAIQTWSPGCGDHFRSKLQKTGPMWWPYNACFEWDTYAQLTNLNNYSLDVIGLYQLKDDNGNWVHGSHDMRMEGPHKSYGRVGIGCNPLLPCSCNMRSYNVTKNGEDNTFTGFGKLRGGVASSEIEVWQMTESVLPKFGNATRSLVRSYRTLDRIMYLDASNRDVTWKLTPATMVFSKADVTTDEDPMWDHNCSNEGPNVVNPLGWLTAESFNWADINETMDSFNRFRYEDVFRCKYTVDIAYQHTVGEYSKKFGKNTVVPWYEFKRYPVGGSSAYIQWAWQEDWLPLERNYFSDFSDYVKFIQDFVAGAGERMVKGSFTGSAVKTGLFLTLDIEYPKYLYDFKNQEFRQLMDEGSYDLFFVAAEKDESTGEYLGYCSFQLGDGPLRGINWKGEWLTDYNQDGVLEEGSKDFNIELYEICVGKEGSTDYSTDERDRPVETEWSRDVTLFGSGYIDTSPQVAQDEDRMSQTYRFEEGPPDITTSIQTHFQRGLDVKINIDALSQLPLQLKFIDQFEIEDQEEPILAFEVVCGVQYMQKFEITFDDLKKTLGKVSASYKFGAELIAEATETTDAIYKYYNIPHVKISTILTLDDSPTIITIFSSDGMELFDGTDQEYSIEERVYEWVNEWEYIVLGTTKVSVEFRTSPTGAEIEALSGIYPNRYLNNLNLVSLLNTQLYEEQLTNATEVLNLHERKYYVSYGNSADCPPQGEDPLDDTDDFRVLDKRKGNDRSGVWQSDVAEGVNGVPNSSGEMHFVNKVRGRLVKDLYEDGTLLTDDLVAMESKQKELYDDAASEVDPNAAMFPIIPTPTKMMLDDAGVVFSGPSALKLKNTTVTLLAELNQVPQMSAEGHRYQPGLPKRITDGTTCADKRNQKVPECQADGTLDSFIFEYYNLDNDVEGVLLVNAAIGSVDEKGRFIMGTADDGVSRLATLEAREMDNPIAQLYRGGAWMVERTMVYEDLMTTYFPHLFDREPATDMFLEDVSSHLYMPLSLISYGGTINYNVGSFADPHWNFPVVWSGLLAF